jgi:ABC-2 type transport system permease protein
MRAVWTIAAKDLRQRLRDRSAIVLAFVAPIALASIISLTFGSLEDFDFETTWVVADLDGSSLSRTFTEEVLGSEDFRGSVTVVQASDAEEARAFVERGDASAAFVIPSGFERATRGGAPVPLTVFESSGRAVGAEVARAVAEGFTDQIEAAQLSVTTAVRAGASLARGRALVEAAARERIPVSLTQGAVGGREVTGANYFGPSMAIFFLFFTVGWGARSLLVERRQGTLQRLLVAPVQKRAVVAGKALTVFVLGVVSMATMFVFMGVVFRTRWGDPLALVALTVVTVLAVMGVTALVGLLAKTDEQADAYASMASITLALLGGNFFPVHEMPELMQKLSLGTPNGWAIRGFTDLVYEGGGVSSVATHLAVIAAFAAVTGGLAVLRARKVSPA